MHLQGEEFKIVLMKSRPEPKYMHFKMSIPVAARDLLIPGAYTRVWRGII